MSKLRSDINISGQGARYILDDNKIVSLFKNCETIKELAKFFNVSEPTIKRRLRLFGVKREPKYTLDENVFSSFTPESCYWAGFIAADGWVGSNHKKKKIYIGLADKDTNHLNKMCKFFKRDISTVRHIICDGKYVQCRLEIGNKKIVEDLVNNFNVVQAKSFILQPPTKILENLIKHYIRGYFDGDGCISFDKTSKIVKFNIISASPNILPWMNEIISQNTEIKIKVGCRKDRIYYLQTSGVKAQLILDWLYYDSTQETRLDRKYERYLSYKN